MMGAHRIKRLSLLPFLLLASMTCFAQWPKQRFVEIRSAPTSEFCGSAAKAVDSLRVKAGGPLHGMLRDKKTRSTDDVRAMSLTFPVMRTGRFQTADRHGVERTLDVDYYRLDIDNDGDEDMLTLSSGGRGPAGEGDTLFLLNEDVSAASQPMPNEKLADVALEIGGPKTSFYDSKGTFSPAYFIYPFSFQGQRYLLIEGNDLRDRRYLVAQLVRGTGVVTRCQF
jgi:hypothetical protein